MLASFNYSFINPTPAEVLKVDRNEDTDLVLFVEAELLTNSTLSNLIIIIKKYTTFASGSVLLQ